MLKLAAISLLLLAQAGCSRDDNPRLEALAKRVEVLEARVGSGRNANAQVQRQRRPEPDVKDVYAVSTDGLPAVGPADAPITIVEGYEYACPACASARQSVAQTLAKYGDKVRVVYKPFIVHPDVATEASVAACAAHEQGKFAAMDTAIWDKAYGGRDFSVAKLEAIAKETGLDMDRYAKDFTTCKQKVMQHHAELQQLGQGATPTFFINGRYIVGANPMKLHAVIDEELALAEQRIKSGTKPAEYYAKWVVEPGKKKFEPKPQG
jgi:protein-disulfide isomerase